MKLRVKLLKWFAGYPVAMLNEKTANKLGVHTRERISVKTLSTNFKETSAIVDTIRGLVKEDEIAVSYEMVKRLNLRKNQKVEVRLALPLRSVLFIKKKLKNNALNKKEINEIIRDVVNNSLSGEEISLFISAMYKVGMSFEEVIFLIEAILKSGNKLSLKSKYIADKHCIGGVPGNRTTPIVVSICAASGLIMPKTSSRAITSAAGTADVIEAIAKIEFSMSQLKRIVKKTNACMVWGGALGMVPADSKIIGIEKTLRIDPEAQLLASIMSKKLAVGSKHILIDLPYGKTAKVSKSQAESLKKKFEKLGRYFHKNLKCVLTDGSKPIGKGIGPILELIDVIKILDPNKKGPEDLRDKSLFLSAQLLELSGKAKKGKGMKSAKEILDSGKAYEKFRQIIKAQKGTLNGNKFKLGKYQKDIISSKNTKILSIDNSKINTMAKLAGCPLDKSSGLYLHHNVGNKIPKKSKIITIYSESRSRLRQTVKFYKKNSPIRLK